MYNNKGETNFENYIPILMLGIIYKVVNKIVFNQLSDF